MVIYDLLCRKKHRFEGWFPSLESYEKQASRKEISCPTCGSRSVEKIPHACAVHVKRASPSESSRQPQRAKDSPESPPSVAEVNEALLQLHHHVRENFEDMGPRFAQEARRIFRGEAEKRAIYGTSTSQEREELDVEGVPYAVLPKPRLDS
jgi:hypothetical protein